MALFKNNGVATAEAEVQKLRAARIKLEEREQAAFTELAALRESLPEIALTDAMSDEPSHGATKAQNRVLVLEYELKTCAAALRAIVPKLHSAMRAVNVAKAEEKRKQAASLEKDLQAHKTKSDALRTALEAHEQCPYAPAVKQVVVDSGERGFQYAISLSARLANQITALHTEAAAIENKRIAGGGAGGETIDDVITAANADPDTIAPLPSTIRAWFAGAFAEAEADFRRADRDSDFASLATFPLEMSIALSWDENGSILPGSAVKLRLAPISRQVATETFGAEYAQPLSD